MAEVTRKLLVVEGLDLLQLNRKLYGLGARLHELPTAEELGRLAVKMSWGTRTPEQIGHAILDALKGKA